LQAPALVGPGTPQPPVHLHLCPDRGFQDAPAHALRALRVVMVQHIERSVAARQVQRSSIGTAGQNAGAIHTISRIMLGLPFLVIHGGEYWQLWGIFGNFGNFWASYIAVSMQEEFHGPYEVAQYVWNLRTHFLQEETHAESAVVTLQAPLQQLRGCSSAKIMRSLLLPCGGTNLEPGTKLSFNTVARGEGPELALSLVHELFRYSKSKWVPHQVLPGYLFCSSPLRIMYDFDFGIL
jgi:hypothetical protein